MTAYEEGFMAKCAAQGLTVAQARSLMTKHAGGVTGIGTGIIPHLLERVGYLTPARAARLQNMAQEAGYRKWQLNQRLFDAQRSGAVSTMTPLKAGIRRAIQHQRDLELRSGVGLYDRVPGFKYPSQ